VRISGGERPWVALALLFLAVCSLQTPLRAQSPDEAYAAHLASLREASFLEKESIAEAMIRAGHRGTQEVLTALLEDRLYFRTDDQRVLIVKSVEGNLPAYELIEPISLADAGTAPPEALTKIGSNNRLRRALRTSLARFGLENPDAAVRLAAVRDMLKDRDVAS